MPFGCPTIDVSSVDFQSGALHEASGRTAHHQPACSGPRASHDHKKMSNVSAVRVATATSYRSEQSVPVRVVPRKCSGQAADFLVTS